MLKRQLVILIVAAIIIGSILEPVGVSYGGNDKHLVLLLQSYDPQNSWARDISRGFFETIDTQRSSILVYEEYMDTKRYRSDDHYENFTSYLENKYKDVEFSLIITADNNAFDYVKDRNPDFFGDVPVVFVGLNPTEHNTNLSDRYSGIYEEINVDSTLKLISDMHPDESKILILTDETVTGQAVLGNVKDAVQNFEGKQSVEFFMSSNLDVIENKLDELNKFDAVVLLLFNADDRGLNYTYNEGLDEIYKRSPAPIYGMWKFYLDQGIVGGYLTDGYEHGKVAADYVIANLQGVEADPDLVQYVEPDLYFDYLELKRYGLESIAVPNDAVVINRPTDDLRELVPLMIAVGIATALISLIIALWYLNKKEHIMNLSLEEEKSRLSSMLDQDLNRLVDEKTSELVLANQQCELLKDEYDILIEEKEGLMRALHECSQNSNQLLFRSDILTERLVQLDMSIRLYHIFLKGNMKSALHTKELLAEIRISKEKIGQIEELYAKGTMKRSDLESYFKNRQMAIVKFEDRLNSIIDDMQKLIDSEQLDLGEYDSSRSLSEVLRTASALAMVENSSRMIDVLLNVDDDLLKIRKPSYMTYVILQLVSNTLYHAFQDVEKGTIQISAKKMDDSIVIEVDDNGLGMNEYSLDKAFDPFFSTKLETGNLGIGLSNVKQVIEEIYKGKVELTSAVNQGTNVKVTIPAEEVKSHV